MSGQIRNIFNSILKRESRIPQRIPTSRFSPLLSKLGLTAPKVVKWASIPAMAGVVKPRINLIDPKELISLKNIEPRTKFPPKAPKTPKKSFFSGKAKWIATIAAGAAAFLTPALAQAGEGLFASTVSFFSSLGALQGIVFFLGACLTLKLLWTTYQDLKPENYQSTDMKLTVGSPTPRKLLKTMVLPAFKETLKVGTIFAALSLISDFVIGIPGLLTWGVALPILAFKPVVRIISFMLRDIKQYFEYRKNSVQRHLKRPKLIPMLKTDLFAPGAWLATVVFMAHMSLTFASQFWAAAGHFLSSIPTAFGSAAGLLNLGEWGLGFALGAAALRFFIGWRKAKAGNPIGNLPTRIRSTITAAIGGAVLGAGVYLASPGLAVTNLVVFACTLAFAHNYIHSTRSQEAGLLQANKKHKISHLQSLWEAVRNRKGGTRTVIRPSVGMQETLISADLMAILSEGANCVINAACGDFNTAGYVLSEEMVEKLVKKDAQTIRDIYQAGYHALQHAGTVREALEAVAQIFENLARLLEDPTYPPTEGHPLAWGDLKSRSGLKYLKDDTFCTGLPRVVVKSSFSVFGNRQNQIWDALVEAEYIEENGVLTSKFDGNRQNFILDRSKITQLEEDRAFEILEKYMRPKEKRSDQDLRVHGGSIRFAARMLEKQAASIRSQQNLRKIDKMKFDLKSLKTKWREKLEAGFRRAFPVVDTHAGRFYTNFFPDSYIAKQYLVDFCMKVMADFVSYTDTVVMTPDGRIHLWAIPLKVVKDFKEDHGEVFAIESRDKEGEDLRFEWYKREERDIGDSLCEIAYIDNLAHYLKYKDLLKAGIITELEFLSLYPTAEVPVVPELKEEPTLDPYLGTHEPQEFYDVVYKNGARLRVYADGSQVAIGGLGADAPVPLMLPGTKRHDYIARMIQIGHEGDVFGAIPLEDIDLAKSHLSQFADKKDLIWDALLAEGYINQAGKVLPKFAANKESFEIGVQLTGSEKDQLFDILKNAKSLRDVLKEGKVPHPFGGYFTGKVKEESFDNEVLKDKKDQIWDALKKAGYIDKEGRIELKFDGQREFFTLDGPFTLEEIDAIFEILQDRKYLMPRFHHMYPTEYFSISDGDQMDLIVTNLRLFHTEKDPHLRVMMIRPRQEELPFSPDMLEDPGDSFLEVGVAVAWMMLKITRKNGKELFIPLNMSKENERTFGSLSGKDLWRYIDERKPVGIDKNRGVLQIPYREQANKDPNFNEAMELGLMFGGEYNNRQSIEEVPIPEEMLDLVEEIEEIRINPERYGEVGGPGPAADYTFVRRNREGKVTDSTRKLALSDRVADMLIFGKTSLLNQEEVEYCEMVMREDESAASKMKQIGPTPSKKLQVFNKIVKALTFGKKSLLKELEGKDEKVKAVKDELPWVDNDNWVHMKMSEEEYRMLRRWIPEWQGGERHQYWNGELLIFVKHFELLCEYAYDEFAYRRYSQLDRYPTNFDPNETDLDYSEHEMLRRK